MNTRLPALIAEAVLVSALALAISGCSGDSNLAGNSSDTDNAKIMCVVYNADSSPARNVAVRLRLADYLTPAQGLLKTARTEADGVTDDNGRLEIDSVEPGSYLLEVNDNVSGGLVRTCFVDAGTNNLDLGVDTLRTFTSVTGVAAIPGQVSVRISGLERTIAVDSLTGAFTVADLPPGSYQWIIEGPEAGSVPAVVVTDPLPPGGAVVIDTVRMPALTGWNYHAAVMINTSSSGADVAEMVTHFPVLIRLDATNFDFTQAKPDGGDLRFTTPYGSPVAWQIDSWDAVNKQAAVWVVVDTIRPQSQHQYLTMYWGNAASGDSGVTGAVFDSTNGFAAVWHFGEAGAYEDASTGGHLLSDGGTEAATGVIGDARYFGGQDSMKAADNQDLEPQNFTISCWFKPDGAQIGYAKLVGKGGPGFPHQSYTLELDTVTQKVGFQIARDSAFTRANTDAVIGDNVWHLTTGTFDAATGTQTLYLNGAHVATIIDTTPVNYYTAINCPLYLGSQELTARPTWFKGCLDEPRIESRARTASWIKLSYENQRPGSGVVEMR